MTSGKGIVNNVPRIIDVGLKTMTGWVLSAYNYRLVPCLAEELNLVY